MTKYPSCLNYFKCSPLILVAMIALVVPVSVLAFDREDWGVRCWDFEEKQWTDRGLEAMTVESGEGVTKATNTSGIHKHAHLVFRPKLEGDFTFTIELKGGYELGFLNRKGKDEMLYLELDEKAGETFETFELSREGTRYTIRRNGRVVPLVHFRFDYGDAVMITLAIKDGESAEIRSAKMVTSQ